MCLTKDNNKVAIVTGSSKGIGKAIATEFAKAGYSVVIN
jgi:NAD(P)-dependent dehydrogenase (short-subunit alcohol dehydrogenase family)